MIRQICGANLWNIDFNLKFQYKHLNEVNISYLILRTNFFSFPEMFCLIVNTPFNKMICNYTSLGPNCTDMWVPHGKYRLFIRLPDLMKLLKQIWKFHLPVALKSIIFIYMHACIMFMKFRGRLNWIFFFIWFACVFLNCSAWYTNAGIWYNKYDIDTKNKMLIHMTVYSMVVSIFHF